MKIELVNEYQKLAQRTANKELRPDIRLAVAGLGLVGEAGEVSELIKKHLGHGHPLNREKIEKELGDVMWYVAEAASLIGVSLSDIMTKNIEKLMERYPEGFNEERSLYRIENDQN